MSRRVVPLVLLLLTPAAWGAQWTRLTTLNFDLYTTAGDKQGREIIAHFERVHNFFEKASPLRGEPDLPVRIIQFSSEEEFRPYRAIDRTDAYFTGGLPRFFIAMSDTSDRGFGTAIHEYTHLAIQASGLRLPLWVNEGWADVNSTLRPAKNKTDIGDLIPMHTQVLDREKWLDFETLTSVERSSPIYNEAARAGIFYAESWALMHMLYLSPEYQTGFAKFIVALNKGENSDQACREAWGKSGDAVFKDLQSYFDRKQLYGRAFELKFDTKTEEPVVMKIDDFAAKLVLADLLTAIKRRPEAKADYDQLEQERPGRADVAESVGYFALAGRDGEAARVAFERAFDEGDTNPYMCLVLSSLEAAAKQSLERAIRPLQRAIQEKPSLSDARLQLGVLLVTARKFPEAITDLLAMPDVKPERATPLFCSLAYAYLETGDLPNARQNIQTCRKWATADRDAAMAKSLQRLVEARSSGVALAQAGEKRAQVQGVLRQMDCAAAANRLVLDVSGKSESFFLPPADAVELNDRAGSALTLTCGVQKPVSVNLEYVPAPAGIHTVIGLVRRIVY